MFFLRVIPAIVLLEQLNKMLCMPPLSNDLPEEIKAAIWFDSNYSIEVQKLMNAEAVAEWDYATDLQSDVKKNTKLETAKQTAEYKKQAAVIAKGYEYNKFENQTLKRLFTKISKIGHGALATKEFVKLSDMISEMTTIYSTATICDKNEKCGLSLDPEASRIMATSNDYDQLQTVWQNWRNESGAKLKNLYKTYVDLSNLAAKANGFKDKGDMWRSEYESDTFASDVENMFYKLETELYKPLHAYVRGKLVDKYKSKANVNGAIPAHLLGNMWAQSWGNIFDIVKPYNITNTHDATPEIEKKSVESLFKISEEFFTSMGLASMTETFWKKTQYEKPKNKLVVCHASAWDFYDSEDFRVKMCTNKNMEDFITIHHEMGHIQYFIQYKDQPIPFRDGANPGFHEAVGDVLALSVETPKHLKEIKLIPDYNTNEESTINFLMSMALDKIAFLPFGFLIDAWRWNVFNGTFTSDNWNTKWWEMRCKYQGLVPPSKRSDSDFDAGAKFHVPNDVPYIRYFVSFIIQFQFHKALCDKANQLGPNHPVHECDFYKNKDAGTLLGNMLKKGSSVPWPEAMKEITDQKNMDIQPLLDYFKPLITFLNTENKRLNNEVGWKCGSLGSVPVISIPLIALLTIISRFLH